MFSFKIWLDFTMAENGKGQLLHNTSSPQPAAENGSHQDDVSDTEEVPVAIYEYLKCVLSHKEMFSKLKCSTFFSESFDK